MIKPNQVIIGTGFEQGFSLRMPDGKIRRFGSCDWHDENSWEVIYENGTFFLCCLDSRDNGFQELFRNDIPPDASVTCGYWDDEHGTWQSLSEKLLYFSDKPISPTEIETLAKTKLDSLKTQ